MQTFRCTSCRALSYSAASLERLGGGARCASCGGDLEPSVREPRFRASRGGAEAPTGRYPLRPSARSSAG